jgi:RNA polymerase sigma factor (TIGR02999 family)
MDQVAHGQLSRLLLAAGEGDAAAQSELLPLIYDELRAMARARLATERAGHTLQPTALVHEAYLRMVGPSPMSWRDRAQFFAAAAEAMRRILIEHARARARLKRGGERERIELSDDAAYVESSPDELLALDEALTRLAEIDSRKAEVVKLRYFAGLSIDETADALGVSSATVRNDWTYARTWLRRELDRDQAEKQVAGEQRRTRNDQ